MYPAQICVGGTALSLYPAYFLKRSASEVQYEPKCEKNSAQFYHFLWLLQKISDGVAVLAFLLASLINFLLDFGILGPF